MQLYVEIILIFREIIAVTILKIHKSLISLFSLKISVKTFMLCTEIVTRKADFPIISTEKRELSIHKSLISYIRVKNITFKY